LNLSLSFFFSCLCCLTWKLAAARQNQSGGLQYARIAAEFIVVLIKPANFRLKTNSFSFAWNLNLMHHRSASARDKGANHFIGFDELQ
jgi:hypothetical protein